VRVAGPPARPVLICVAILVVSPSAAIKKRAFRASINADCQPQEKF
jgi:hypothetical protein